MFLLFLLSVALTSVVSITPSKASEKCFSKFPDSAWGYVSTSSYAYRDSGSQAIRVFVPPPEVSDEVSRFPKDYVLTIQRQISKNKGDWAVVDKVSGDVRLPLVPGDRYRNVITYEGRNCTKRVINLSDLVVKSGRTPTLNEYVSKFSQNFQQESENLARLVGPFPIKFPTQEVTAGEPTDVAKSPHFLSLIINRDRNTYPTIDFKDGCAKVDSGPYSAILPNTWRKSSMADPNFTFLRGGTCRGDIYSYAMEGDLLPFLIGTIEYKVSTAKPTPSPSSCTREGASVTVAGIRYVCVDNGVTLINLTESDALPFIEAKKIRLALEEITKGAKLQRATLFDAIKKVSDKVLRDLMFEEIEIWDEFLRTLTSDAPNNEGVQAGNVNLAKLTTSTSRLLTLANRKVTITCVKGNSTRKVTAVNPKCPKGFKKK